MEEKLEEKKEWITPEIIDLDVEKTGSGSVSYPTETTTSGYHVGPTSS